MASPDTNTPGSQTGGDGSERGTGVVSRMRESASAQLSSQKNKATEGLGTVAQAVRQSTQQLRDQQHETLAGYVESAANQIEQLSQRLRDKDVGELLEDAQRLARRQPAVFIGSAFALGLLGVRFFKSSARRDRQNQQFGGSTAYNRGDYMRTSATGNPYRSQAHDRSTTYTGVQSGATFGSEGSTTYTGSSSGTLPDTSRDSTLGSERSTTIASDTDDDVTSTSTGSEETGGTPSTGRSRRSRGSSGTERS